MANAINRLTARQVQTIKEPGRHADGGGLYLVVEQSGAKRWVMLYRFGGRRREMGLGSVVSVPLAMARELAAEARAKIARGLDPIEERQPVIIAAPKVSFADIAIRYMDDHASFWRNTKHRAQWRQTLEVQAAELWSKPVADISTDDVLEVLRPLWHAKAETARRIRGRIERVLDAARTGGHRSGENPARWRGHLDTILPRATKLQRGHHAALPIKLVPIVYANLVKTGGVTAQVMRLIILTAARSGEVRGAPWSEFDFDHALWTIPAARMKAGRIHRVPLQAEALDLLRSIKPDGARPDHLVFPSRAGTPLSDMALGMLLRRMGHPDVTTHGFRSSFRDWVDAETDFAGDLAEAALAHLVGDETERAYRRGDALAKRRHLMDAWARFVVSESGAESKILISSE